MKVKQLRDLSAKELDAMLQNMREQGLLDATWWDQAGRTTSTGKENRRV